MNREDRKRIAEDTASKFSNYDKPKTTMVRINKLNKLENNIWFNYKGNVVNESIVSYINKNEGITVLNFASAKNPGGGFLSGSNAQEESLSRASNLVDGLNDFMEDYYEVNRSLNDPLYTDIMLYSKDVTFFKNDFGKDTKLTKVNVITSPAPNAGAAKGRRISEKDIDIALKNRIYNIVQLAVNENVKHLALGAFGCGVFKNDSRRVAMHFKNAINQLVKKDSMVIKFVIYGLIPDGFR